MIAKNKKVWGTLLLGLLLPVFCVGCKAIEEQKREDTAYEYRQKVAYDYEKEVASPEHEVLFQNEEKTIVYKVKYQQDVTAKEATKKFESVTDGEIKTQTTWEDAMWEYNRFCYENEYAYKDDEVYFHSVDCDIELSQYVVDDKEKKSVTETLFFDRADGTYMIEMIYPTKDVNAKMMLYYFAVHQSFQVDIDHIKKVQEGLEWKDEVNENGELVVTVINNGDETVEHLSCLINTDIPPKKMEDGTTQQGAGYSFVEADVAPGQMVTFSLTSEQMKEVIDYRVEVTAYYSGHKMDLDKSVWNLQ